MQVSSDSKRLYATLSGLELKRLYDYVINTYQNLPNNKYRYFITDKQNGVFLRHCPLMPYVNYTTSLQFHGYSNCSQLLKDIFTIVPLHRWMVKQIDISFDSAIEYHDIHVVHPPKRATVNHFKGSLYMGGKTSAIQLHMYDKQREQLEKRKINTDTWTRIELRFRFTPMKPISKLTVDDFSVAEQYHIITDINALPPKERVLVQQLNQGDIKWSDVKRRRQGKIREHAIAEGMNLNQLILSQVKNINVFIYSAIEDTDLKGA